jgi:DUF4097 and DUF4098 domain-containing protein YvlB
MTIRSWLRPSFTVVFAISATACALDAQSFVEGGFQRSLPVSGPVRLDVRTSSGSIAIWSGASDAVRVTARIRGRERFGRNVEERVRQIEANPPVELTGGTVRIGHLPDNLARDVRISYEITTPPDTQVISQTGSGDQTIEDVRGPVIASTGSGSLRVARVQSDVRASTGSGDLVAQDLGNAFTASTGSGSIRANGISGAVHARSGSGDVEIRQTDSASADVNVETGAGSMNIIGARRGLHARSGAGDIRLDGRPGSAWDIETGAGGVRINVATDASFQLNARTSAGSVDVDAPFTEVERRPQRGPVTRLRGAVRGGGPLVDIFTSAGNIHVQ